MLSRLVFLIAVFVVISICSIPTLAQQVMASGWVSPTGDANLPRSGNGGWLYGSYSSSAPYPDNITSGVAQGYTDGYYHIGYDAVASQGQPIYAIASGTVRVKSVGSSWDCYGNEQNMALFIEHETSTGQKFLFVYGHLLKNPNQLIVGSTVVAGQQIGIVGAYPCGGAHLHVGVIPSTTLPGTDTNNRIGLGRMGNRHWNSGNRQNSFVDPIAFLRDNSPKSSSQGKPDLKFGYMTCTSTVQSGGQISLESKLENIGAGDARDFKVKTYISSDSYLGSDDIYFAGTGYLAISGMSHMYISGTVNIPAVPGGTKYIIAKIDAEDALSESNESNNTVVYTIYVLGGSGSSLGDQQAKDDMKRIASNLNSNFRSPMESTFKNEGTYGDWEYRSMYFNWANNKVSVIVHATYKFIFTVRFVQYYNPDTGQWSQWVQVY